MNDLVYITERQLKMKEADELSCRHWLLFFRNKSTDEIVAYDGREPQECYRAVMAKHPDLEFLELRGCDSVASAVEYAKAIRLSSKMLAWVHAQVKARKAIHA